MAGRSRSSTPKRGRQTSGDGRQRLPGPQRLRAHEVQPEIAVAEPEPVLAAELGHGLERVPRLVGPAPAAGLVGAPGQRVEDAVQVGRDRQAEDLEVVADVPDRRHVRGLDRLDEPAQEAGGADPAGEDGDLHSVSRSSARRGRSTETAPRSRKRPALPGP